MLDRKSLRPVEKTKLTCIRGKYDESYIQYTIEIIRKCKGHGFRVCMLSITRLTTQAHQQSFHPIKMYSRDLSRDRERRTGLWKLLASTPGAYIKPDLG